MFDYVQLVGTEGSDNKVLGEFLEDIVNTWGRKRPVEEVLRVFSKATGPGKDMARNRDFPGKCVSRFLPTR